MNSPLLLPSSRPPRRSRVASTTARSASTVHEPIFLDDGTLLLLRPIAPGDVDALMRAFKRMTPEQVRARVFHALSELPEPVARSMCRIDPDHAVALVATDPNGAEIRGEARVHFDLITESAELAIAIDPDYTGRGLGRILIERLIAASRAHAMREIWGDTQAGNNAMLALTTRLGFSHRRQSDDATLVRFQLDLQPVATHLDIVKR
ncbi:MAG: GNAT family N-acetyltransferase [Dokdonella sp.]|uniref:GNAT family N-acetyltransferase n=1 Tax=Dokdonella sp. TaxID=2291710 RepID=UPI003BAFDECE